MLIGLVHGGFVVTVLMSQLRAFHPRMASEAWGPDPTRQLEPPGNFGLNYGASPPMVTLVAHYLFGGILGYFYTV